jgi:hypothetical protein
MLEVVVAAAEAETVAEEVVAVAEVVVVEAVVVEAVVAEAVVVVVVGHPEHSLPQHLHKPEETITVEGL